LPGKTRLRNDLLFVEWDVKPYTPSLTHGDLGGKLRPQQITVSNISVATVYLSPPDRNQKKRVILTEMHVLILRQLISIRVIYGPSTGLIAIN